MTCYSMEQHPSHYSFQALYKSFDSKKDNIRQNKKQPLPSIKSNRYNSILCNTVSTTSHSKLSTSTLDSNYYKISKTLQAIRHKVKSNSQCHNLPETIRSYGEESIRQLTDRKKKKDLLITSDNPPISEFMSESKEICMKNLLIKIIKTESSRIEEKEVNIGKALDIEKINLENDQYLFHEYSETKKKSFREIEKQLLELEKNNKMLSLKLKDIKIENLGIKDEIRKYINLIEINRQYAFFINRSMKGGRPEFFNVEYRNVDDIMYIYSI